MGAVKKSSTVEDLLTRALLRLKRDNPQTSLRSLALRMDVSPSYLSKVMRGLKPVSPALIPKLQKAFHLDLIETKSLQRLTLENIEEKSVTPSTGLKSLEVKSASGPETYRGLTKKDFLLLEKWYYIPLLNLITVKGFKSSPAWVAQKLGISSSEADQALRNLIRTGYILNADGMLSLTSLKARFPTDKSHDSIRKYHQAMMKKASAELNDKTDEEAFANRLINSISFAGDIKKMKQAQEILNQALYEVAELMANESPDNVFQINLQFFKITN